MNYANAWAWLWFIWLVVLWFEYEEKDAELVAMEVNYLSERQKRIDCEYVPRVSIHRN